MIGLGAATLIGSGLSFLGGLIGNSVNSSIAQQNMTAQEKMNRENINFIQKENDITRQREDNAVQRAAADMTAAGLSKTLAAGNPASAQALSAPHTQAVQNQFKYESALMKLDLADKLSNIKIKEAQVRQMDSEADKNAAQTTLFDKQGGMFDKQAELFASETALNQIVGEYKGQILQNEIDQGLQAIKESQSREYLNQEELRKAAAQTALYIAQKNNLSLEASKLTYQIIAQRLDNEINLYNFKYAKEHGQPTNYSPSTFGKWFREFEGLRDFYSYNFDNFFGLHLSDLTR